jgi:hypothetical protein
MLIGEKEGVSRKTEAKHNAMRDGFECVVRRAEKGT